MHLPEGTLLPCVCDMRQLFANAPTSSLKAVFNKFRSLGNYRLQKRKELESQS